MTSSSPPRSRSSSYSKGSVHLSGRHSATSLAERSCTCSRCCSTAPPPPSAQRPTASRCLSSCASFNRLAAVQCFLSVRALCPTFLRRTSEAPKCTYRVCDIRHGADCLDRGIFYAMPMLGPSIAPIIGGGLAELPGSWRNTFRFLLAVRDQCQPQLALADRLDTLVRRRLLRYAHLSSRDLQAAAQPTLSPSCRPRHC